MMGGCVLLTNGLEWVGKKRNWSHGVVGSVFASLATALPETCIPLIAILFFRTHQAEEIGVGAILGAPLVLSTVALATAGGAALFRGAKSRNALTIHIPILQQDLVWFIVAFSVVLLSSYIRINSIRTTLALALVVAYVVHVKAHFQELGSEEPDPPLLLVARRYSNPRLRFCAVQALLGIIIIVSVAYFFVSQLKTLSLLLGVAPAFFSLLVSPFASELPEMINSAIWMRQGRGTLALGNITGAILFQGTALAALGMSLTPWLLDRRLVLAGVFSLAAAFFALFALRGRKLSQLLLLSVGFYLVYLLLAVHMQ
jgi:cation:H+ antiporter